MMVWLRKVFLLAFLILPMCSPNPTCTLQKSNSFTLLLITSDMPNYAQFHLARLLGLHPCISAFPNQQLNSDASLTFRWMEAQVKHHDAHISAAAITLKAPISTFSAKSISSSSSSSDIYTLNFSIDMLCTRNVTSGFC